MKGIAGLILTKGRTQNVDAMFENVPDGEASAILYKAATTSATTTAAGWAAELVQTAVADYLGGLGPVSAGSQLLRSAMVIEQDTGEFGTSVPSMLPVATGAAFVDELAPIPVKAFATSLVVIEPKKIAAISAYTREMTERTSFETILRQTMAESVGLALDFHLFGAAAAGTAPAGLRNGVGGLAATAGGGDAAMSKDIGAWRRLPVGGDRIAFVAAPGEAAKLRLRAGDRFPYPVGR